jgi:hypothetical protein
MFTPVLLPSSNQQSSDYASWHVLSLQMAWHHACGRDEAQYETQASAWASLFGRFVRVKERRYSADAGLGYVWY